MILFSKRCYERIIYSSASIVYMALSITRIKVFNMRGSRTLCQRGSYFDNVFFSVDEGRGIHVPL